MSLVLFDFQSRAANELADRIEASLSDAGLNNILLHMPMASGKTTTSATAIDSVFNIDSKTVVVFISKGDLPKQANKTFHKLVNNNGKTYDLSGVKQMDYLSGGTVLTLGWEALNNSKISSLGILELTSKHVTGTESTVGLAQLIQNTVEHGNKVVVFVDEAHEFMFTPASQAILRMLHPSVTVAVTATPKPLNRENANYSVYVGYDEVRATGLIKQNVHININLSDFAHLEDENAVLEAAWQRYLVRKEHYELAGYDINPLIMVQLPSDSQLTQDSDRLMIRRVEEFFANKGVTEANGGLAIWLADKRSPCIDSGDLQANNGKAKVLLFKTAVATGIDIPRASILCILRKSGSVTLSTQVAGRILRQPTLQIMGDEVLDSSDIITNLPTDMIQFEGADVASIFKTVTCSLKPELAGISFNLPNVKMFATTKPMLNLKAESMIIDKASPLIVAAKKEFEFGVIAKQNTIGNSEVSSDINDILEGLNSSADSISLNLSSYTITKAFREWVKSIFGAMVVDTSQVYKLVTRGIKVLEDVLAEIGVKKADIPKFIIGSKTNANKVGIIVKDVINQFINDGKLKTVRDFNATVFTGLPLSQNYMVEGVVKASSYSKNSYINSPLMFDSLAEKSFDSFIDGLDSVKTWSVNQPKAEGSLAIKYESKDKQSGAVKTNVMYPDRLILLADSTLLIAEVKSGRTAIDAGEKSNALQSYIAGVNLAIQNGKLETDIKQVIGGIVDVETTNGQESYRIFTGETYTPDRSDSNWKELSSAIPQSSRDAGIASKVAELEKQLAALKA